MMKVIKCKSGKSFAASVEEYADAEWILQEAYYKAQGCVVETEEIVGFEQCECDHCKTLEHKFNDLIEEIESKLFYL